MSAISALTKKIKSRYQRMAVQLFARRPHRMQNREPLISFTFDDFPRSALHIAGASLQRHGVVGTYYTSLGLMGQKAPTGEMFLQEDLATLLAAGHELACHTFAHCHSYETTPDVFEQSVLENQRAMRSLHPAVRFQSLSYPISWPRVETKRRCARYFLGCRAGGQTYNTGTIDLNYLSAFFLEQSRDNLDAIKQVIDANRRAGGWLIFATHDVCADPTHYGCVPELFDAVLRHSIESGARILPVSSALQAIGAGAK